MRDSRLGWHFVIIRSNFPKHKMKGEKYLSPIQFSLRSVWYIMDFKKQRVITLLFLIVENLTILLQRDLLLEFRLSQWIEEIISETKPAKISFEDWIADGTILSKYELFLPTNQRIWSPFRLKVDAEPCLQFCGEWFLWKLWWIRGLGKVEGE